MVDIGGLHLGRRIRNVGRVAQITQTLARHGLWSITERMGLRGLLSAEEVRQAEAAARQAGEDSAGFEVPENVVVGLPARLRRIFEELGPAFVKLGQTLAVREDLLPPEYIAELRKLHAEVATIPYSQIKEVLGRELGANWASHFSSVEEKPLAAGSIAQVHLAILKNGNQVVIKVQRPDISQQIDMDLSLMEEIALMIERYLPEARFVRPRMMVKELRRALEGELDFIREAGNMSKTARNFANTDWVEIPNVYWELTTERLLTISFLDGIQAWDRDAIIAAGIDPVVLVERGLEIFLQMVFVDGLFHGDLHPGNLIAMSGNRCGILDFGITVYLSRHTRENLANLLVSLVDEDFDRMVLYFLELADPRSDFDADAFQYEVSNVIAPFIGLSLAQLRTGKLFWDLAKIGAKHGAPMPQELIVFVKTLVTFEGVGTHLNPDFDLMKSTEKFTAKITSQIYNPEQLKHQSLIIARDLGQMAKQAPFQMRRIFKAALEGELAFRVHNVDMIKVSGALDRSATRLSLSLLTASFLITAAIFLYGNLGPTYQGLSIIGIATFLVALGFACLVGLSIVRGR